jgi:serine/threonine-protein kinase
MVRAVQNHAVDPFGIVGQVLDGQFRVDRLVGEGGFSAVYRGHHLGLQEPIAIKCLKLPPSLSPPLVDQFVKRFRDESRILYRLSQGNLNVVRSIAGGTWQANTGLVVPYMVLEWLEGRSLANDFTIRRTVGKQGRSLDEVVQLFAPAADGLGYAHSQGVVHRDVNPGNLFLVATAEGTRMKVLDFGVAKILDESTLNIARTHTVGQIRIFAPAYGAPEQFDDTIGPVSAASDVYAFALILLEALRDRSINDGAHLGEFAQQAVDPNRRPTPRMFGLDVPDEVEQIFARATALDPRQRWQNAGELWQALALAASAASQQKHAQAAAETPALGMPPGMRRTNRGMAPPPEGSEKPPRSGTERPPPRMDKTMPLGAVFPKLDQLASSMGATPPSLGATPAPLAATQVDPPSTPALDRPPPMGTLMMAPGTSPVPGFDAQQGARPTQQGARNALATTMPLAGPPPGPAAHAPSGGAGGPPPGWDAPAHFSQNYGSLPGPAAPMPAAVPTSSPGPSLPFPPPSFAQGRPDQASVVPASIAGVPPKNTKTPLLIALGLGVLALVGVGLAVAATHKRPQPDPVPVASTQAPAASAVVTPSAPPPPAPEPPSEPAPTPEPTPTPAQTATATASAAPSEPAPTAKPVPTPTNAAPTSTPVVKDAGSPVDPNAFNETVARSRLAQANGVLVFCKKTGGPTGPGTSSVTFAPDGSVTTVVLDPPYAGTPTGDCVAGQFRRTKANAFVGAPRTIKHAFEVPK